LSEKSINPGLSPIDRIAFSRPQSTVSEFKKELSWNVPEELF